MTSASPTSNTATVETATRMQSTGRPSVRPFGALVSVAALLRGCPFLSDDIHTDIAAFVDQLEQDRSLPCHSTAITRSAILRLKVAPTIMDFLILADKPQGADPDDHLSTEAVTRLHFYAALLGHDKSWWKVAAHAVSCAYSSGLPPDVVRSQVVGAVVWLLVATGKHRPPIKWKEATARELVAAVQHMAGPGPDMIDRMLRSRALALAGIGTSSPQVVEPVAASFSVEETTAVLAMPALVSSLPRCPTSDRTIVFQEICNVSHSADDQPDSDLKAPDGESMRLAPIPDLARVRHELLAAFPHAAPVISAVLNALPGSPHLILPPTMLVGPRGVGKTLFAEMLAHVLNVPCETYSCAGPSGSAFAGRPCHSATGQPLVPASVMRRHHHANPVIVLDDLDKADASMSWPNILPGLLEPQTTADGHDPYVEVPSNLSHVIWIGTATSWKAIPTPLQDRFQPIAFPAPRLEHLELLVPNSLHKLMAVQGMNMRWAASLDHREMKFVRKNWKSRSLRHLTRLLEAVLAAREQVQGNH